MERYEDREMDTKPLLCRLNLRHHWTWQTNEDGKRFRLCSRCGKDYPVADHPGEGTIPPVI